MKTYYEFVGKEVLSKGVIATFRKRLIPTGPIDGFLQRKIRCEEFKVFYPIYLNVHQKTSMSFYPSGEAVPIHDMIRFINLVTIEEAKGQR